MTPFQSAAGQALEVVPHLNEEQRTLWALVVSHRQTHGTEWADLGEDGLPLIVDGQVAVNDQYRAWRKAIGCR